MRVSVPLYSLMVLAFASACGGAQVPSSLLDTAAAAIAVARASDNPDVERHAIFAAGALAAVEDALAASDADKLAAAAPCASLALAQLEPDVQDKPALAQALAGAREALATFGGVCSAR